MPIALPQIDRSELIWLLELKIGGTSFFCSTVDVSIMTDNGSVIAYEPSLTEPDYSETLARFSHTADAMSTAIEVVLPELNVSKHRRRGFQLQEATGELSCVFAVDGVIQQTYENRFVHVVGTVSEPAYAHPDRPVGYLVFSLDGNPGPGAAPFHNSKMSIRNDTEHFGKVYPFVFGEPGLYINEEGTAKNTSGSPGYNYTMSSDASFPDTVRKLLVAGHHCDASTVTVWSGEPPESKQFNVTNEIDGLGLPIATVDTKTTSGGLTLVDSNPWRQNQEYWISWTGGKAAANPRSTTGIVGAGDLFLWAFSFGDLRVDYGAWSAARAWLNEYKFAGFINDPGTTVWDWVTTIAELIPPLTIRNGLEGVHPVIQDIHMTAADAISIVSGPDFYRTGPIQVHGNADEIRNTITIEFAYRQAKSTYLQTLTVGAFDSSDQTTFATKYSTASINRFGVRAETISSPFIYDRKTAERYLSDLVRLRGSLGESVEYEAGIIHSNLMLGDVLRLTDDEAGFSDQLATVIGKRWAGAGWVFDLLIEDDPVRDSRPI